MDTALNYKTGEIITAWQLELKDPSYQFPYEETWYADTNNIETYDKEKVKDVTKIEVRYRKAAYEVINAKGTKYDIPPCFFILNKEELGINTVTESKEHKLAKHWIYNTLKNGTLNLEFSTVKRPFDYSNTVSMKDLKIAYQKIDIEVHVNSQRRRQRADIILPFNEFHDLFGAGIVIEVQFSKQDDSEKRERSINWALKGYSICWIDLLDFNKLEEDFVQLKEDKLKIDVYGLTIKKHSEKYENDFRLKIQEMYRASYDKIKEFEDRILKFKQELASASASKILETSQKLQELKQGLANREENLLKSLSQIESNPLAETFNFYKIQMAENFNSLSDKFQSSWKEKMRELNYPFAIRECPMCHHGILYRKETKTGKQCYGCSAYPSCKHTIWIN